MQKLFKPFTSQAKSLFNLSKYNIAIGDTIPHVNLKLVEYNNGEYTTTILDSHSAFENGRVILIGYPGNQSPLQHPYPNLLFQVPLLHRARAFIFQSTLSALLN